MVKLEINLLTLPCRISSPNKGVNRLFYESSLGISILNSSIFSPSIFISKNIFTQKLVQKHIFAFYKHILHFQNTFFFFQNTFFSFKSTFFPFINIFSHTTTLLLLRNISFLFKTTPSLSETSPSHNTYLFLLFTEPENPPRRLRHPHQSDTNSRGGNIFPEPEVGRRRTPLVALLT